jgi:hypothetical protein
MASARRQANGLRGSGLEEKGRETSPAVDKLGFLPCPHGALSDSGDRVQLGGFDGCAGGVR